MRLTLHWTLFLYNEAFLNLLGTVRDGYTPGTIFEKPAFSALVMLLTTVAFEAQIEI